MLNFSSCPTFVYVKVYPNDKDFNQNPEPSKVFPFFGCYRNQSVNSDQCVYNYVVFRCHCSKDIHSANDYHYTAHS